MMQQLVDFYTANTDLASAIIAFVIVASVMSIGLLGMGIAYLWNKLRMGEAMLRRKEVKEIASDYITSALLEAHNNGDLTAREINRLYRKLARQFGWPDFQGKDLLHDSPDPAELKELIKQRLGIKEIWTKVNFPDTRLTKVS